MMAAHQTVATAGTGSAGALPIIRPRRIGPVAVRPAAAVRAVRAVRGPVELPERRHTIRDNRPPLPGCQPD